MVEPPSPTRRNVLGSLGVLGAGATVGSVGAFSNVLSSNVSSSESDPVLDPIQAARPVWLWRDVERESGVPVDGTYTEYLRGELTLQYFGARWDPSPEDQGGPVWRHQFFLVGTGYAGRINITGNRDVASAITDQSFSVQRGTVGEPTIVQLHDTGTMGFIPPDRYTDLIEEDVSREEIADFVIEESVPNHEIDYFEAAQELNGEVTNVTEGGLNGNHILGLALVGAGVAVSGGWLAVAIGAAAAVRIIRNGFSRADEEPVNLPEGFEYDLTTDPAFAQMHFAAFEVLTEAHRTGDIEVASTFEAHNTETNVELEVEIPSLPEPDVGHSCLDSRDVVRGVANAPTPLFDDTRGYVLESPGEPEVDATAPGHNEEYEVGEPVPMVPDLSDDVIEHHWYASHEDDEWCRVDRNEPGTTSYTFYEPGRASVALYARNEAGLSAVERYSIRIADAEGPGNGPGDNPGNGPGDNPGNGPGDDPGNDPEPGTQIDISVDRSIDLGAGEALQHSVVRLDARDTTPESAKYEWTLERKIEDANDEDGDQWHPMGDYPDPVDDEHEDPRTWTFERGPGEYRATLTVSTDDDEAEEEIEFTLREVAIEPSLSADVEEDGGTMDGESRAYLSWQTNVPESWFADVEWIVYDGLEPGDGLPVQRDDRGPYFDAPGGDYTVIVKLTDTADDSHQANDTVTLPEIGGGGGNDGDDDDGNSGGGSGGGDDDGDSGGGGGEDDGDSGGGGGDDDGDSGGDDEPTDTPDPCNDDGQCFDPGPIDDGDGDDGGDDSSDDDDDGGETETPGPCTGDICLT